MSRRTIQRIVNPISNIIGEKATRSLLQVVAVVAPFIPGGQVLAAVAAIELALLYGPRAPKAETATQAFKSERPPRISAYGRIKLFGSYILYANDAKGSAVDAWAFHDGRIDAIEGWYLGDKKVVRQANGFVAAGTDGAYGNDNIQIGANLGAATETPHAALVSAVPTIWTSDHRGDGVVTGYMISKAVKATNYQKIYPSGGPNQTPLAIVMRAQPVFDWRDPAQSVTDPLTWTWSENAVLHLAHYQLVRNDKIWTRHFAPTLAYWTAAADDADIAMPLKAGGTEPRYRSCVSHRHAGDGSEHKAVIAALLGSFNGWMAPREDGALVVYSGRYYPPTVSIGPDIVVGYTVEDGVEDENAINEIGLTYVSADHDFNTVDTDPWTDEADILARGAVRSNDLANQVPSASQARRLAKRLMIQSNAPKRGTFTTLAAGKVLLSERFINLTLAEMIGTDDEFIAYDGPAEITGLSRNLQTGTVQATWIAADPDIDAWDPATEEGNAAPVGVPAERQPLATPTIQSVTAVYSTTGEVNAAGGMDVTGVRLRIIGMGPARDDLEWRARWRPVGTASWIERDLPDDDPSTPVSLLTDFVQANTNMEVQIAFTQGDGRSSDWSSSATVTTGFVDDRVTEDGNQRVTETGDPRIAE
jgi:hypothetical protein